MFFEKMIWSSSSEPKRDSTYITLEYVINDIGIFCKGERRTKSLSFAASPMAMPLELTVVEGKDYAARPLGRAAILWKKITDVTDDPERSCIIVKGNHSDNLIIQYSSENKDILLSRINEAKNNTDSKNEADETAAAWLNWCADMSIDVFKPLDDLIEAERDNIANREYTDAQLQATVIGDIDEDIATDVESNEPASDVRFCPSCGAQVVHREAKFCTNCGTNL